VTTGAWTCPFALKEVQYAVIRGKSFGNLRLCIAQDFIPFRRRGDV